MRFSARRGGRTKRKDKRHFTAEIAESAEISVRIPESFLGYLCVRVDCPGSGSHSRQLKAKAFVLSSHMLS